MNGLLIGFVYLEAVNIAAFLLMGADKRRARKGRWRIPEATLMLMALLGGGIGILAGMLCFHHKTHKPRFTVGVPAILLMEVLFFVCLFWVVSH